MSVERLTCPLQDAATGKNAGTKGMIINGMTYVLIGISAIPLLFFLWRVAKASIRDLGLGFSRYDRNDFFDPRRQRTHRRSANNDPHRFSGRVR